MDPQKDILQEIPTHELPMLRDYYSNHLPYATHVYSFFSTAIKWIQMRPDKEFFKFYAPKGEWRSDGTFIVRFQFFCYYIFLFTMDPKCERLHKALCETKKIDYSNNSVLFYATHINHKDVVVNAMEKLKLRISAEQDTYTYWMPKEEAAQLTFTCPEGYYVDKLNPEHAPLVNQNWPHRSENSLEFIRTFIEMNTCHGVFTKKENKLVSWCLKTPLGALGLLQTLDEHKRKGLGSIVTKSLSKQIALEGHNPMGTILVDNHASKDMFTKMGFKILNRIVYLKI